MQACLRAVLASGAGRGGRLEAFRLVCGRIVGTVVVTRFYGTDHCRENGPEHLHSSRKRMKHNLILLGHLMIIVLLNCTYALAPDKLGE